MSVFICFKRVHFEKNNNCMRRISCHKILQCLNERPCGVYCNAQINIRSFFSNYYCDTISSVFANSKEGVHILWSFCPTEMSCQLHKHFEQRFHIRGLYLTVNIDNMLSKDLCLYHIWNVAVKASPVVFKLYQVLIPTLEIKNVLKKQTRVPIVYADS